MNIKRQIRFLFKTKTKTKKCFVSGADTRPGARPTVALSTCGSQPFVAFESKRNEEEMRWLLYLTAVTLHDLGE